MGDSSGKRRVGPAVVVDIATSYSLIFVVIISDSVQNIKIIMEKSLDKIQVDIESEDNIGTFDKNLIHEGDDFEKSLSIFDKYIQVFLNLKLTRENEALVVSNFGVLIYRYCEPFMHDFKRSFKVTSKMFEILNTFNVNVKSYFAGKIMGYIEICAKNMLLFNDGKEKFMENFLVALHSFMPAGNDSYIISL